MSTPTYKFEGNSIPIRVTWKDAMYTFKDLGLNLLGIFKNEEVMLTIFIDDETMIKVWWHYIKDYSSTMEVAIEDLSSESFEDFKNKFWQAVVNFSSPLMRDTLQEMARTVRKELSSLKLNSKNTSTEQSEEQG